MEEPQKNNPAPQEKKEFLSRQDVKTMREDVSSLREGEAAQERERVAKLKTAEEIQAEREKIARAQKEAQARKLADETVQKREESLTQERQIRQEAAKAAQNAPQTPQPSFKEAFKDTQAKEEEDRKRFLDKVSAQAQGENISAIPKTPALTAKVIGTAQVAAPLLKKPSSSQKFLIRLALSLLVLAVLAALAVFWYWYLAVKEKPAVAPPEEEKIVQVVIPPALITVENSQTIEFSNADGFNIALAELLKTTGTQGQSTRLVLKNTVENKIWGIKEFFEALQIKAPEGFAAKLDNDFTLLVSSQEEGRRISLVAKIKEGEITPMLNAWEATMESDFSGLFGLLGKTEPALAASFKNGTYSDVAFRFQTFSRQDLGIVYAVHNEYFILTTSWQGLQKILDKLKEEPVSFLPFSPNQGAEFILKSLSLKEKVGQVFLIGLGDGTTARAVDGLLENIQPGSVLLLEDNIKTETQLKELTQGLQKASLSYTGLPLLIAADQEGGEITRVAFAEEKTAQNDIADTEEAFQVGLKRGGELLALGINLNLGPMLDSAESGDFLFSRSFQKGLAAAAELAKSLISGQKESGILTTLKHFPGYDGIAFNPEEKLAVLPKTPDTSYFQQAAAASPELIMTSNAVYSDLDENLPFTFSKPAIKFLRERLGKNYLIISDDLCQKSLLDRFSLEEIVKLPVQAGVDILICSEPDKAKAAAAILYAAVENNEISEERIDSSVLKIIQLKESLVE